MKKMDSLIIQSFILFMRHLLLLCVYDFTLFSFPVVGLSWKFFLIFHGLHNKTAKMLCVCAIIFFSAVSSTSHLEKWKKQPRGKIHDQKTSLSSFVHLHSLLCCIMRDMKKRLTECDEHKTGREKQQWKGENLSHLGEFSKEWENYSDEDLEFQVVLPTIFSIHFRPLLARWSALSLGDELEFHFVNKNNQSKCDSSDSRRVYIKKNYIAAALGKYLRIIYQTQNDLTSSPSSLSSSSSAFSLLAQI